MTKKNPIHKQNSKGALSKSQVSPSSVIVFVSDPISASIKPRDAGTCLVRSLGRQLHVTINPVSERMAMVTKNSFGNDVDITLAG